MCAKENKFFPVMGNMTVKQVREYLKSKRSIIIPIGVIEQHGYHLPLETDALIATHLGKMIGKKTDVLVAPTMYESFSGGSLPGTINISPAVMSLVISDRLVSLASQGFRNFYLFLCHGGSENAQALDNAIKILLRTNPEFKNIMVSLMPIWDLDPNKIGWRKGIAEGDWHAGWVETSMVMALTPELVQTDELETDTRELLHPMTEHPDNYQQAEKIVDDKFVIPRMSQKPDIKVGVMGFPERASADLGRKIIKEAVDCASKKIIALESKADGIYKEVVFTPAPILFDEK